MRNVFASLTIALLMPLGAFAQPDWLKPRNRVIELDPDASTVAVSIVGAPYHLIAVVMPEAFTLAKCSFCQEGEEDPMAHQNWHIDQAQDEHTIFLKATRLPDRNHPLATFNATIHVTLESGYRIVLNLSMVNPSDSDQIPPDNEVSFSLPARARLAGRLAELDREREAEFKALVDQAATDRFLIAHLGKTRCRQLPGLPHRNNKLVVRLLQTCTTDPRTMQQSSASTHWVIFSVENRGQTKLNLASASLTPSGHLGRARRHHRFEASALLFDERVLGVAMFYLPPATPQPPSWQLVVSEEGGLGQSATLDEITF